MKNNRSPGPGDIIIARDRFTLYSYGPDGPYAREQAILMPGDRAMIVEDIKEMRLWSIILRGRLWIYSTPYVWDDDWDLLTGG